MFGGFLCPDPLPEFLKFLPQPPCGRGGGLLNRNRYQFLLFLLLERCVEPAHDFGVHGPIIVLGRLLKATSEALEEPYLQLHGIG